MTNELKKLPNISEIIAGKLVASGIDTPEKLMKIGSKEAFLKIRLIDNTACLNLLHALEGAIQGIRWYGLSKETKSELKAFYKSL